MVAEEDAGLVSMNVARRMLGVGLASLALGALAQPPAEADRAALAARRLAVEQRARGLADAAEAKRREAAAVHARIAALAGRVGESAHSLRVAEARYRAARRERAIAADRLAAERAPLARLLAALVRDARRPTALALAAPDSLVENERRRVALAAIRPAIEARGAATRAALVESDAATARAAAALRTVETARRDLEDQRHSLAAAEAGLGDQRALVLADEAVARQQAQGLAEQAAGLDSLIAGLRRDARLGTRLATLDGPLPRPGGGGVTTSPRPPVYGLAVAGRVLVGEGELSAAGIRARGLTLATAPGARVAAPAGGRIAYAGPFRTWRAIVIIDHGHGWITLVTGLDRAEGRVGAPIAQGQAIGRASARVTIELRHRGRPVDVSGMIEAS